MGTVRSKRVGKGSFLVEKGSIWGRLGGAFCRLVRRDFYRKQRQENDLWRFKDAETGVFFFSPSRRRACPKRQNRRMRQAGNGARP